MGFTPNADAEVSPPTVAGMPPAFGQAHGDQRAELARARDDLGTWMPGVVPTLLPVEESKCNQHGERSTTIAFWQSNGCLTPGGKWRTVEVLPPSCGGLIRSRIASARRGYETGGRRLDWVARWAGGGRHAARGGADGGPCPTKAPLESASRSRRGGTGHSLLD